MSLHHWLPVIYTVHCRVLFNSSQCFTACLKVAPQKKVTAGAPERCSEGEVGARAPGLPWGQGDSELPKLVAPEPLAGALQVGLGTGTGGWSRREPSELQAVALLRPGASSPASVRAEEIQGIVSNGTKPGQAALPPGGVSSPRIRSLCTPRAGHGDRGIRMALPAGHRDSEVVAARSSAGTPLPARPTAPTAHLELRPRSRTGAVGDIELDILRREG